MSIASKWSPIRTGSCALWAIVLIGSPPALADLVTVLGDNGGPSSGDFSYLGTPTKWDPGENTASFHGFTVPLGPMRPGGASWSVMPAGTPAGSSDTTWTTPETNIYAGSLITGLGAGTELDIFTAALDAWAEVSGFTNLDMRSDNGAASHSTATMTGSVYDFGDIRIGAHSFDGQGSTLAHGYQPGTEAIFSGTIAGDVHFDADETWIDVNAEILAGNSVTNGFDFFSVVLHEFGHALGLGHSTNPNAVMFPSIGAGTSNRTLHADDIAGITVLYGTAAIPEPSSFLYLGFVTVGLLVVILLKW